MARYPHPSRTPQARLAASLLTALALLALAAGASIAGAQADLPNKLFLPLVTQQAERRLLVQQPDGRIVSVDQFGHDVRELVPSADLPYRAAWSPDGSRIAYTIRDYSNISELFTLNVINADGSGRRRLSDPAVRVTDFSWAPDGTSLLFTSAGSSRIYRVNVDGSGLVVILDLGITAFDIHNVQFSPDGRTIAYQQSLNIYLMNPDGSGNRRLTTQTVVELDINWSPDSSRIAFRTQLPGREGLMLGIVRVADGTLITVEVEPVPFGNDVLVAWAPDGNRLALTVSRDSRPALAVLNNDGTGLAYLEYEAYSPAWSPDGSLIAFSNFNDVYVIRPDGSGLRKVIAGFRPKWQPMPAQR